MLDEGDTIESGKGEGHRPAFSVDEHVGRLAALEADVTDGIYVVVVYHRAAMVKVDVVVLCVEPHESQQKGS